MDKPKVAFVCTQNACRSQMAEALANLLASNAFEAYSAGTSPGESLDPGAVRCMQRLYGVDMPAGLQRPKDISELPQVDAVVTMGCGARCPWLPTRHREDWGIDDPTGKNDTVYDRTAGIIQAKVLDLKKRILIGEILKSQ
jgi:arsenate reductase